MFADKVRNRGFFQQKEFETYSKVETEAFISKFVSVQHPQICNLKKLYRNERGKTNMIRHIVAWNFKESSSEAETKKIAEKVKAELESLNRQIPEIIELTVDISPASTSSRNVMLHSLFQTQEDLNTYQNHPEHQRVSAFVGSVMADRICLDFYE